MRSANRYAKSQCQLKCQSIRSSSCGSSKARLGFPSNYVVWSCLLSLQDLSLEYVDFSDSVSGMDLFSVSSFPSLKRLKIRYCRGINALKIFCPNLEDTDVYGMNLLSMEISGMRLEKLNCYANSIDGWVNIFAPNLQTLYWGTSITEKCSIHGFPTPKRLCMRNPSLSGGRTTTKKSVRRVMSFLSQLENLEIDCHYLGSLSEIYLESGGLPFSFKKLGTLNIGPVSKLRSVSKLRYIPGIACLLKSSPVVHTLDIGIHSFVENDEWNNILLDKANCTQKKFWKTQAQYLIPFLSHLKVVRVYVGYTISENAITFAKFLLKYGRGLQKMTIVVWLKSSRNRVPPKSLSVAVALLRNSPRASAAVELSTLCA